MSNQRKLCIIGAGGFGKETLASIKDNYLFLGKKIEDEVVFLDDKLSLSEQSLMGISIIHSKDFNPSEFEVVIAIEDSNTRQLIANKLPIETKYATLIHSSAIIMENCEIGEGSIISAGCILTANIKIGVHCHLNLNTTIAHSCTIGDYFTAASGVNINSNCTFGNLISIGSNTAVKQNTIISDEITIGMGEIVKSNILNK